MLEHLLFNGPREVTVKRTNCEGVRGTPAVQPAKAPGTWLTKSDGRKIGTMIRVLRGPDSFLP